MVPSNSFSFAKVFRLPRFAQGRLGRRRLPSLSSPLPPPLAALPLEAHMAAMKVAAGTSSPNPPSPMCSCVYLGWPAAAVGVLSESSRAQVGAPVRPRQICAPSSHYPTAAPLPAGGRAIARRRHACRRSGRRLAPNPGPVRPSTASPEEPA
jgi:hypothetical protein